MPWCDLYNNIKTFILLKIRIWYFKNVKEIPASKNEAVQKPSNSPISDSPLIAYSEINFPKDIYR